MVSVNIMYGELQYSCNDDNTNGNVVLIRVLVKHRCVAIIRVTYMCNTSTCNNGIMCIM